MSLTRQQQENSFIQKFSCRYMMSLKMHANIAQIDVWWKRNYMFIDAECAEEIFFALKKLNSRHTCKKNKGEFLVPCHGRIFSPNLTRSTCFDNLFTCLLYNCCPSRFDVWELTLLRAVYYFCLLFSDLKRSHFILFFLQFQGNWNKFPCVLKAVSWRQLLQCNEISLYF